MSQQHTDKGGVSGEVHHALEQAVERAQLGAERVLVGASAGLDSTVLAHALVSVLGAGSVTLGHVHHGLRGEESDLDAACVASLADALGCDALQRHIAPQSLREGRSSRDRPTLQEAAREARHAALQEMADAAGAACVATGHHQDDQAETVLLRLFRGTGPDGLGGIRERSRDGRLWRPLLGISRASLAEYARENRVVWREDGSNQSTVYTRNRLRRDWLPKLAEAFNPKLLQTLADLAEAQQTDSDWIAEQVAGESARRFSVEGTWLHIDAKDFSALHEALARRLMREALSRCGAGRQVTRVHLHRMVAFLSSPGPGRTLELPGGIRLERDRSRVRLGPVAGLSDSAGGAC